MLQRSVVLGSAFMLTCSAVQAGDINAVSRLTELLATKPPVPYFDLRNFLDPISHSPAVAIDSYVIETSSITFDKGNVTSLPEVVLAAQKTLHNCADATLNSSISLSLSGTRSWSTAKTDGVTTTMGANVGGSVGVPGVAGGSVNFTWSQAISTSTTVTDGGSETVTRAFTDTVAIGPKKAISITARASEVSIELPFHATVVVDGALRENVGLSLASQLLTKDERTFTINGKLLLKDVSEASIRTDNLIGDAACTENEVGVATLSEIPAFRVSAANLGPLLGPNFQLPAQLPRNGNTLSASIRPFGALSDDTGPTIGSPDGTYFEILYTTETAKPAIACGFNDIGLPITGIFAVEARQYRTYANGILLSQWQETVETFRSCMPV